MVPPEPSSSVAPHRGFSTKAREMLLDRDEISFDVEVKRRAKPLKMERTESEQSHGSSKSSVHSIPEPLNFDNIDEATKRKAKLHKTLGELGKTRSVGEFKNIDRRLMRTFQQDNILRLPSADSDLGDYPMNAKPLSKRAAKYEVNEDDE